MLKNNKAQVFVHCVCELQYFKICWKGTWLRNKNNYTWWCCSSWKCDASEFFFQDAWIRHERKYNTSTGNYNCHTSTWCNTHTRVLNFMLHSLVSQEPCSFGGVTTTLLGAVIKGRITCSLAYWYNFKTKN